MTNSCLADGFLPVDLTSTKQILPPGSKTVLSGMPVKLREVSFIALPPSDFTSFTIRSSSSFSVIPEVFSKFISVFEVSRSCHHVTLWRRGEMIPLAHATRVHPCRATTAVTVRPAYYHLQSSVCLIVGGEHRLTCVSAFLFAAHNVTFTVLVTVSRTYARCLPYSPNRW